MKTGSSYYEMKKTLVGSRVMLSGAIPERDFWESEISDYEILEFVSYFSALIFKKGGTIVHGAHPSFTPILVNEVKKFGARSQLKLFASNYFSTEWLEPFSEHCELTIVEKFTEISLSGDEGAGQSLSLVINTASRNKSLTVLRNTLISSTDSLVAIGGKVHLNSTIRSGVKEEIELAALRGIKCYNVGSFGGATEIVVNKSKINNIVNDRIMEIESAKDVSFISSIVVELIESEKEKIDRVKLNPFQRFISDIKNFLKRF